MKKIMFVAVMAFAMVSCGGNKTADAQCNEAACCDSIVATDVVPAAVGETPATEVVPAEPAN